MNKNFQTLLSLLILIIAGCSKSKTPGPNGGGAANNPKLQIVSGNNQSAAIGASPTDTISVKITGNTLSSQNYYVEFRGSCCNADLPVTLSFEGNGISTYSYRLAGNIGSQTLQATLVEHGSNKRIDSVTFNLTGTATAPGINRAACTPFSVGFATFCKNLSGRIFVTFGDQQALRYSDDNGISWNPVKSLGTKHNFISMKTDGKNHMMLFAHNEGIYYSADGGQTWELHPNAPFKSQDFKDMNYSSLGTMFFTTLAQTLYYSEDNGNNWIQIKPPAASDYRAPLQASNGDFLIFLASVDYIYRSQDKGITWKPLPSIQKGQPDGIFAFYLDNSSGWLYKAVQNPRIDVYVSKDNGATFSPLGLMLNFLPSFIQVYNNIIYLADYNYAYKFGSDKQQVLLYPVLSTQIGSGMIVADNGNFIGYSTYIVVIN